MKKLWMIGLGGSIKNANIEVHAMQHMIAEKVEDCYEDLIEIWYGDSLHLDSYTALEYIDGYKVDLKGSSDKNLYMIVYGGYQKGVIDELHDYNYLLADSKEEAEKVAKSQYDKFPNMNHVDEIVDIFDNMGIRFGFIEGDYSFKDNETVFKHVKLKKA